MLKCQSFPIVSSSGNHEFPADCRDDLVIGKRAMNKENSLIRILFLVALALTSCKSSTDHDSLEWREANNWLYQGWACAPKLESPLRSPYQYCAKASPREYLYVELYLDDVSFSYLPKSADRKEACLKEGRLHATRKGISQSTVFFVEGSMDMERSCRVVGDGIQASEVGLYGCCSREQDTGNCQIKGHEDWKSCLCIGYLRMVGGQRAFEESAEKGNSGIECHRE